MAGNQGQNIEKDHLPRHELYKKTEILALATDIYVSKAENPPTRRDESVRVCCKVTWDTKIDWDSLDPCEDQHGRKLRRLDYNVEMKCDGGSSMFYILHNGRRQAAKNVSVEVIENSAM